MLNSIFVVTLSPLLSLLSMGVNFILDSKSMRRCVSLQTRRVRIMYHCKSQMERERQRATTSNMPSI